MRSAIAEGITVTDETVRREARLYVFGDDDAWNQTPADNKEWLRLFKLGLKTWPNPLVTTDIKLCPLRQQHNLPVSVPGMIDLTIIDDFFAVPEVPPLSDVPTASECNAATTSIPLAWQTP